MKFQNNHHQTGSNNIDSEKNPNHEHNEKPILTNEESGNSNSNDENINNANVNNENDDETNDNHIIGLVDNEGTMTYNMESLTNVSVTPDAEVQQNEKNYDEDSRIDIVEMRKSSEKKNETAEPENKIGIENGADPEEKTEEKTYENRDSESQTPKEIEEPESKQENHNSDEGKEIDDGEKHFASNKRPSGTEESNENEDSKNEKEETQNNVDILVIERNNENEVQMGIRKSVCHKVLFS